MKLDSQTCVFCSTNPVTKQFVLESGDTEMICDSCCDHLLSGCFDENCPICPSDMMLVDAIKLASLLGVKVEKV